MSQTETAAKTEAKPANHAKAVAKPKGRAHVPTRAVLLKLVGKKVR